MNAGFTPSPSQAKAGGAIRKWWNGGKPSKPWMWLGGHAGTGKSVLLRHTLADLGLVDHSPEHPGVITATYTGKAALVQCRMGVPARTIHSLIYRYIEPTDAEIQKIEDQIAEARRRARLLDGDKRFAADAAIAAMQGMLDGLFEPQFILDRLGSDLADCDLLVLDEVSMVGRTMAEDLLSFCKPILVIGDPGQLPPIKDEGYFTRGRPDVMLTEIHRQAADNPIIRLATMAREGQEIPFGKYGDGVAKILKSKAPVEALLRADQVLCARNDTRRWLNNGMRKAAGVGDSVLPVAGERVICLRNDKNLGLINGMFMRMRELKQETEVSFSARLYDEDDVPLGPPTKTPGRASRQHVYRGAFDDHVRLDPDRYRKDWQSKRGLVEADHGHAITVHKAQGSEFGSVVVWDEQLPGTEEDARRLRYTAITRAKEKLCIVA